MSSLHASNPRRAHTVSALLSAALLAFGSQATAEEQISALWQERTVDFTYRSALAIYSCEALQRRVASIMRAIGARDDMELRTLDCVEPLNPNVSSDHWKSSTQRSINPLADNPEQRVRITVRAFMPAPASPELLAQLKKEKSRRELVARVTGKAAAGLEPSEFPAQRRTVEISRETIGIEGIECELLDQMSASAFRKLEVKIVSRSMSCNRSQVSNIPPKLTVEALVPAWMSSEPKP